MNPNTIQDQPLAPMGSLPGGEMTGQELFDAVVLGIRRQGKMATAGSRCLYLAPDGCRCAAGQLMIPYVIRARVAAGTLNLDAPVRSVEDITGLTGGRVNIRNATVYNVLRGLQNAHDSAAADPDQMASFLERAHAGALLEGLSAIACEVPL